MTTLEGRVVRRRKALDPPGGARSRAVGVGRARRAASAPAPQPTTPREVFDELARASAGGRADYSAITYDRLDAGRGAVLAVLRPRRRTGTPRLFLDRFATADGRAHLVAVDHHGPADDVRRDARCTWSPAGCSHHYQSGAQTRRVAELVEAAPGAAARDPPAARRHLRRHRRAMPCASPPRAARRRDGR